MESKSRFNRLLSGVIAGAMAVSMLPGMSAFADETVEKYPYTMFAGDDTDGAITVNADNFCVNGSVATNGTIVSSGNMNINGSKKEHADEEMMYIQDKLNNTYFSNNVTYFAEDYTNEDMNINLNSPTDVQGSITLNGNANVNSAVRAMNDIVISGEVMNSNNAVIYSQMGDINLDSNNVGLSGLVYAPFGDVEITAQNLNLNNVVIIADTITLTSSNINANYNNSVAEFVGTTSGSSAGDSGDDKDDTDDIQLLAYGTYNSEVNSIDVEWFTDYTDSDYEIWTSNNNDEYTSVAVVSDATTYQYPITEDFETKYFKVSLTDKSGEIVESTPFVVTKSETGYSVNFLDTDSDGLADIYEDMLGTDINLPDTDEDGLTDYQEVYIIGTDPKKFDSVTEGVSDADADSDNDGLSNAQEIELGTDPKIVDTDNDGLLDGEEVNSYGTDPLMPDTDDDGLNDGDEPHIGLDPLNPETFDVPDAEFVTEQTISSDSTVFDEINTEDSPYTLSINVKTSGYAENNINVTKTSYENVINNDAMLGVAPEISCNSSCNIEEIVLNFEIGDSFINNSSESFNIDDLNGIKRLNVFKFDEDLHMLIPIKTTVDVPNNAISASDTEVGTYCIMDLQKWFEMVGISSEIPEDYLMPQMLTNDTMEVVADNTGDAELNDIAEELSTTEVPMLFSLGNESVNSLTNHPKYAQRKLIPVDVVFMLQVAGTDVYDFNKQLKSIADTATNLFSSYLDNREIRIAVVTYGLNNTGYIYENHASGNYWFTDLDSLISKINNINYTYINEYISRNTVFNLLFGNIGYKSEAAKFAFEMMNGPTYVYSNILNLVLKCSEKNIAFSEIEPVGYTYDNSETDRIVRETITNNNGLYLTTDEATGDILSNHVKNNVTDGCYIYNICTPTDWKANIELKDLIYPDSSTDTDDDGLTDWQEIDTSMISWDKYGEITLPSIADCINKGKADINYISVLTGESSGAEDIRTSPAYTWVLNQLQFIYVLPILSDPTNVDTDGDGMDDGNDFDSIHFATEEQIKIVKFFESAELFEIKYLSQFCERFECSPIIAIDYINVYRKHDDYAIDEVIKDLELLGYKCDKTSFQIFYTEYFNYRDGTSWSQIMSTGYTSWTQSFKFFLSTWVLDNAFQVKNAATGNSYKLSKKQQDALEDISKASRKGDIVKIESAEKVNNEFKNKSDYKPPYQPGTKTITIKLKENKKFVRVYPKTKKMSGNWVMEAEQIEGLTPSQIKDKFALEYLPKYICDVEIPEGSTIRYGIANKIVNWGDGGGTQYDLLGQYIGEFTNERLL